MSGVRAARLGAEPQDRRSHRRRRDQRATVEAGFLRHHRGVRGTAGHHHVHGDAAAFELRRMAGGHGFEPGLGRPVGVEPSAQHGEEARGDVHAAAPALREQPVDRGTGHAPCSREVHGDEPLPCLGGDPVDPDQIGHVVHADHAHADRTVVDEDVQAPEGVADVRDRCLARGQGVATTYQPDAEPVFGQAAPRTYRWQDSAHDEIEAPAS